MKNNLIGALVLVVCSLVVVGSVLVPYINNVTTTHTTFDNTEYSYFQMKELEVGDVWESTDDGWTYNGDLVTSTTSDVVSIVATNDLVVRLDGLCRGVTFGNNLVTSIETIENDGEYLLINTSKYVSYTFGYGATLDGDFVMKTYSDSAYVNGDSLLWVTGYTALGSTSTTQVVCHIEGTIDDGFTISVDPKYGGTVTDISVGDYTLNYEVVDGYEDLYLITSIEFDVTGTVDSETVTSTFTYSTFVLPKEVTAELSQHLTAVEISLVSILPLLIVAGIVCGFAFSVMRNRDY